MIIKDPYSEFVKEMRKNGTYYNPSGVEIGQVIESNPLTIKASDLTLSKDNLLIADYLLNNYSRQINLSSTNASGNTTNGNITSIGISNGTINFTDTLKKDDLVALIQVNSTTFIILCRVVKP